MTVANIVLGLGTLLTALHAGLLYDFSVDIVPSLRSIRPKAHIEMMQAINVKIENPRFFVSFIGSILLLPLATFLHRGSSLFVWLLAATVLQIFFCAAVTAVGNIPLNNQLAKVDVDAITESEAETIRTEFQAAGSRWMLFHAVRTLAGIAATAILILVCLLV